MPLIKLAKKNRDKGAYLLVTSGQVGFFPEGVFGVTQFHLDQLEPRFKEMGVRYHRLGNKEIDRLMTRFSNGRKKKG